MDLTDKQIAEKIAAFEKEQDPARINEALELVETSGRDVPAGDVPGRRAVISRWLQVLAALDQHIDPKWDPGKKPKVGAPLPSSHGPVFPSGDVDPATIPDPAERARYERDLKASRDSVTQYNFQFQLRRADERAMRSVGLLITERFTNSDRDRTELEALIAASPVTEPRKKLLRALIPGR